MNNQLIAAALHALAVAFETPGATPPEQPAQVGNTAAENALPAGQKRGRGRPVRGEDAAPVATPSTTPAVTPVVPEADPFASPKAAIEDVRAALTALKAASSQDAALAVLKKAGGAGNLTDLPSEKYGVVVAAVNVELRIIEAGKKPAVVEADPFEVPATATTPAAKPLTIEDVKAAVVAATKRTGTDIVQKLVMEHGGKANNPETGASAPSLKAIPEAQYEALVKAISELPTTK